MERSKQELASGEEPGNGRHSARGRYCSSLTWCAWQESNLLPLAPQASALSGELQAQKTGRGSSLGGGRRHQWPR